MRAALLLALALAACGSSDDDPGPSGTTLGEDRQLNEAADALDINAAHPEPGNSQ